MTHARNEAPLATVLEGEEVRLVLSSKGGLTGGPPGEGDHLLLTSRRVVSVWRDQAKHRQAAAPLERVEAVEVTELTREGKPLVMGGLFLLAGVLTPWVALVLSLNGVIAWLLAGVFVLLGVVTASSYFAREQAGAIIFRAGTAEVALPLRTPQAVRDANAVAQEFFLMTGAGAIAGKASQPYAQQSPYGPAVRWSREMEAPGAEEEAALSMDGVAPSIQEEEAVDMGDAQGEEQSREGAEPYRG